MRFIAEFKQFIAKGNVIDLAVAVVIGTAFGSIVTSLVNDIMMPPIGVATGGVDFTDLKFQLSDPVIAKGVVIKQGASVNYGNFIQTVINFLIIAAAVFTLVKSINALKRKEAEAPASPVPTKEELLLTEIRDLLKNRSI